MRPARRTVARHWLRGFITGALAAAGLLLALLWLLVRLNAPA